MKLDNAVKINIIKTPVNVPSRILKTDSEGYIRVKLGDTVYRVKPEEFFANPDDIDLLTDDEIGKLRENLLIEGFEKELGIKE